jgi:hypothetical protein
VWISGNGPIERSEVILIRVALDKSAYGRPEHNLKTVMPNAPDIAEGDTLKLSYEFRADYHGDVAAKLDAIGRIVADESLVKAVEIEELKYGRSVIVQIVQELTRIIDTLEGR